MFSETGTAASTCSYERPPIAAKSSPQRNSHDARVVLAGERFRVGDGAAIEREIFGELEVGHAVPPHRTFLHRRRSPTVLRFAAMRRTRVAEHEADDDRAAPEACCATLGVSLRCAHLCLAIFGFRAAELAVWIALAAYAYTAGGVAEASAVVVAELIPATLVRVDGRRLDSPQRCRAGAALGSGIAVLRDARGRGFLTSGANVAAYVGAIIAATAITTTRPAQSALMPSLVDGPEELTAANVLSGSLHADGRSRRARNRRGTHDRRGNVGRLRGHVGCRRGGGRVGVAATDRARSR